MCVFVLWLVLSNSVLSQPSQTEFSLERRWYYRPRCASTIFSECVSVARAWHCLYECFCANRPCSYLQVAGVLFLIGKVGGWFTSLGLLYTREPPAHLMCPLTRTLSKLYQYTPAAACLLSSLWTKPFLPHVTCQLDGLLRGRVMRSRCCMQ